MSRMSATGGLEDRTLEQAAKMNKDRKQIYVNIYHGSLLAMQCIEKTVQFLSIQSKRGRRFR